MKKYTFEVVIHEGNDEFWERKPTDEDVTNLVIEALELYGLTMERDGGYERGQDTVALVKMERI